MKRHLGPVLSSLLIAGITVAALRPESGPPSVATINAGHRAPPVAASKPQTPRQVPRPSPSAPPLTPTPVKVPVLVGEFTPPDLPPGTELHFIGTYKGAPAPGADTSPWWSRCVGEYADPKKCHARFATQHEQRFVDVDVASMGHPVVLALTSYEPTLWRVHPADPAQIVRVILGGYHAQSVTGLATGTPVEIYTHDASVCDDCLQGDRYFFAFERGKDRQYLDAVKQLWKITGLRPTTFQGTHMGKRFVISDRLPHLSYPDDPAPQPKREHRG